MGLFDKATANVKYTPQQPTTEVAEQQATSPLPPTDNPQQEVNFTQPTESVEPQRTDEQKQLDSLYATNKDDFISKMNQRYGILPSVGQNRLNYKQLSEQMQSDGLTTSQMREVQQQWIKSVEAYRDSLPGGDRKEELTKQIDTIKSAPMTYQEDTFKNKAKEVWRNTTPAVEAQIEHVYNAASQYVPGLGIMTDKAILEKYDPEFLKKVEEAGGIDFISNIGKGAKINVNEDGWGVGGMLTSGATKEQQDLGKELLAKLDNYRATETLKREDKEGEEVILPDGRKEKMSNRQAAMYYAQQGSSVAGRDEWHKEWENNPLSAVSSLSGVGNMFADMLGSTISNAPTMVAGAAATFFHPALGLAIVNSGNITQQEFDAVNEAVSNEYKKLHGKNADVTKLSADEYAAFIQDLAKKGVVSKASADGVLTGSLMTAAESFTGGLVGKLGGKAIAAMTPKELANTLGKKLSNIAYGSVGLGLKVSDEGLQEVASTIVENARKGKPLDDGLTQSYLMGTFSIENALQHGIRGVGKARKLASKGKEQDTEQGDNQDVQQPETATDNLAEPTTDNAQSPTASTSEVSNKPNSTTSPNSPISEDKAKLLSEYEHIINNADEDGNLSDEDAKRAKQIEDQFYNEDGTNTLQSDLNAWVKNGRQATTQDNQDEHRADNRDGTANADGATIGQGLDVTNGSGAERSSETSEQVSPTQTETTTEGNSQSNTQPTSDSTGQPHNLTQESNSTGIDGRTSKTDTVRGEQGELGQDGSKQGGEPTQATSETSTDSRVQQRSQSNSVGETLGDKEVDSLYREALSDRNAYRDTDVDNIDNAIRQSEANLARYIDEGDHQNVEYEDNYLRQAYARKEQLTGENQLDNYKRRRNELGVTNVEDLQANKRKQRIDERNQQRERQVADKEISDLGDAIYQAYKKAISNPFAKDLPQQREQLRSMLEEHNERSDKAIDVDRYMRKFDERIKNDTTFAVRTITNLERKAEEIEAELNELIDELANISKNAKGKAVDSYNEMKSKIRKLIQRVREFFSEAKGKISNAFTKKFNELKLLADNLLDDISNFKPGHKLLTAKAWSNKTSKSAKKLRDVTNDTLKLMQDKNNEDVDADDLFGNLRSPKPGKKGSVIDVAPNKASQIKEATSRLRKNVVERSGLPRVDLSEENQQDRKVNSYGDQTNKPVDVSTSVRHKQQSSVSNERTETISPSDTTTPTRSTDATRVSKSERKDSGEETLTPTERLAYPSFMTDEEIIAYKNRLKEFAKEAKKNAHTREFLAARKGTFKSKAEMVDAMQKAMSEHLEDTELNAELFKHASSLIDQHKGRKGWGKNSAELALPKGAKMSLTNVIGSAEKAHREEVGNSATEQATNVEPNPVDDLVSEIKAFKGKPKAEDVSAFRDKARELKASLNPKVRSAINKLADKLDDDEYLAYADTEQRKREERKEKAYKEVEDAIKGERTYEKSELTTTKDGSVKATVYRGGETENRGIMWFSTNERVAATYARDGNVHTKELTISKPKVIDAKGVTFSQVQEKATYTRERIRKEYPELHNAIVEFMYGKDSRGENQFKKTDRLVYDTLAHNALVKAGVVDGDVYTGVVIRNVIDAGNKNISPMKGSKNDDFIGDNVVVFNEQRANETVYSAIKKEEPKENTVANFNKENRINSAIDNAVASEEEKVKPYLKEFKTGDLRSNQKRASELLKDNPKDTDQIKEAFFDRTPNARPASWGVVERGYIRFDIRNPNHKAFKGTRVGLLGFDFDGNAVYGTEEMAFDDIKKSDTAEDITTITLAQQPKDTRETTDKAVENVIRTNPALEQDMRDVVEEFAKENDILEEDGSPVQGTNENIAWASNNADFMSWLEKGSKALHAMFKKVQSVLAGVLAVVAVGAMTVPNDAMAHTGYSVYESGPKIENVSQQASDTINWVVKQKDHNGKAFVVADKAQGKILIVDTDGKVLDSQNAIFGKNKGDSTAFGNTPSGRFQLHKTETKNLSDVDKRVFGDSVLDLTDKETGRKVTNEKGQVVAMHRVVNTKQRHAALNSATANDNYLSHGCINVPTAFYNSANSKLDGAMVYVLNQDGSSNMSDTKGKTKSDVSSKNNEQSQSSDTSNTAKKTGVKSSNLKLDNHTGLNVAKKSSLKFSVKAKDITRVTGSVSVDKLRKALDHALGDLANNVNFITAKDYGNTQGFDKIRNAGVEGFYDPINKQVYIVADNIEAQNGLSAEERMAWVAWHELVHNGLDVKHGDELGNILYKVQGNSFISQLAEAIMQDRRDNQLTEIGYDKATEEALAELGAAIKTGKVKALASRYKVELPLEYQGGLKAIIGKHLVSLRQLISKVLGKKVFTTKQVERLLEDALKEVKPDEATKAFAEKALADINDPESAFTKSVMFSVADKAKNFVKDVSHVISGGDISRTGSTPARDGTKAAKERTTRQGFISRIWTGVQDSQQVIIDLDPEGNGGRLSNAVATFSNKAAQMGRRYRSRIKNLEMKFNKFAAENKDLFPNRRDRRQIDHIVQDVTSSLRTITGGNEQIRKRVENTIFGEDIYDNNGNFVKHIPGLADRVQEYSEYIANAKAQGLAPSSYITARLNEYTKLLDDQIAIQNTFDKSDATIIQRSNAANDTSRKNWRGHDGFTTAEAEQKLRDLKAKGFIDFDVDNLTKVPYQVKRFIKGVNGQPDTFTVETHYRYETKDVKALAKGRIMPLVDEYVALSQDMYQEAVNLVGKDIMGDAPSEEWQVGTMGKVRNAYTTQAKDANGNVIDGVYDVSQNSNIDNIISLRQAAEYQSRLNGRAFNGGTALENLTWHVELMSKQAASKNIGKVLYDLWQDPKTSHLVRVYRRNDKDYSSQNGILITRDKVVGGRVVKDANGNPVQEVIKVAFADEEANRALFGDNIAREELTNGNLIARALFGMLSNLTKLGSLGLTGSVGFSIPNAIKGYNEKLNQMLAWSSDNPFVKSLPQDIQDKYFAKGAIKGFAQGTKLQATTAYHKYANTANLKHMGDMQLAATIFSQELINNNGKIVKGLKAVKGLSKGAEREYQKLVYMYEQGGISSRVEELINSSKELKLRFATGPRVAKWSGKASKALETAASVTMSQELVSSLMMFDLLTQTLGMPPEKAVEANLHFMNFNKRGTWKIMDYIRRYTMFGNAIAQGSKAFQNAWIEQTNDPNHKLFGWFGPVGYTISDRAIGRAIRNVTIGMGMNLAARMWAESVCGGSHKDLGSPFDSLNPYELMRDIPIAYDCDENGPVYFRFPVEYGTGNVENAAGVSVVQVLTGAWSAKQGLEFVMDSLRDNALPISMPVMKTKDPFQLAVSFLMPLVPEPAKGMVLAFGGIDSFGNPLNSMSYQFKDYKPGTGKKTTDQAWTELAESLYGVGIFGNLSPEQVKVLATSWTQGVFREMLTHAVEDDPKGSLWGAILGAKSVVRDYKGYDKIAYTMAQTYLQSRYDDLNEIAIKAEGTGNPNPSTKWLEENGYEMDEKESKLLKQVLKYRASLKDKTASQERRYKNNVDFIKSMRAIEGYNDN